MRGMCFEVLSEYSDLELIHNYRTLCELLFILADFARVNIPAINIKSGQKLFIQLLYVIISRMLMQI